MTEGAPLARSERLGVLVVGVNGAVATTAIAGARAVARGLAGAGGLLAERPEARAAGVAPLAGLRFAGWDLAAGTPLDAARRHRILPAALIDSVAPDLAEVPVLRAPTRNVTPTVLSAVGARVERPEPLRDSARRLVREIDALRALLDVDRAVLVHLASVEPVPPPGPASTSVEGLERALDEDSPGISPAMLYAYAAISAGVPHVNFTPSVAADVPSLDALARERGVPYAGKDGKTGQTLYKGALAAMFRARDLRVKGWYSVNILGNADGAVLRDPAHASAKVESKSRGLAAILGYEDFPHAVRIDYYPPRGDAKEAWDVVDFEGFLGAPMSLRVNWQGQDSLLAAPLVLDLARFADVAQRRGDRGAVGALALYFKSPVGTSVHDLAAQERALAEWLAGRGGPSLPGAARDPGGVVVPVAAPPGDVSR